MRKDIDVKRIRKRLNRNLKIKKCARLKLITFPKFIYVIKGAHHRRTNMISINTETDEMESSFIIRKKDHYSLYCGKVYQRLDNELSPIRIKIKDLLIEYQQLMKEYKKIDSEQSESKQDAIEQIDSIMELREADRKKNKKESIYRRLNILYKEINELYENIRHFELYIKEELISKSAKIEAVFTSYCHGAMHKAWDDKVVPKINIDTEAEETYIECNKEINEYINNKMKEISENAEN